MKTYWGFALGLVLGCGGLLLAQSILNSPAETTSGGDQNLRITLERQAEQLDAANKRIATLQAGLEEEPEAGLTALATSDKQPDADSDETDAEETQAGESFIDILMSFGDAEMKRKIEEQVTELAARLGLDENQTNSLREALLARAKAQMEAGKLIMTRKATLEDLVASDEHNFRDSDAAIMAMLSEEQQDEFALYQRERETRRVEAKADEELGKLTSVVELSEEQADRAWQVFADFAIAEPPGELPEGATPEDFGSFLDDAISQRIDRLSPILDQEQLDAYQGEAQAFRDSITKLVGHATGTAIE